MDGWMDGKCFQFTLTDGNVVVLCKGIELFMLDELFDLRRLSSPARGASTIALSAFTSRF